MMLGQEPILKMRKQGFSPRDIFVVENKICSDWFEHGDHATVCIFPDEPLEQLDLRFSYGTVVHITSDSENRAKRLLEAFKGAGAQTVACSHVYQVKDKSFFETGFSEIWHK